MAVGGLARGNPGDHVHVSTGGMTTASSDISIDLEAGESDTTIRNLGSSKSIETRKTLTVEELGTLRAALLSSLQKGLESKVCLDQDEANSAARKRGGPILFRPPTLDAIIFVEVKLDGQLVRGPDVGCASAAYNTMLEAIDHAASPRDAP